MKIIYHCFGGAHSSVTAAALHLGLLNKGKLPTPEDLMALPYYDKTNNNDFGTIRLMGTDQYGNDVYVLGKKSLGERFSAVLMGLAEIMEKEDQLLAVNCIDHVNWGMKLGGFTSRKMKIPWLGRPVVTWGTKRAFNQLVNLVEITRIRCLRAGQS